MLEERAIQIRVGLFVSTACVLAAIIIFMLGSERAWFQRKYELRCRFPDTSGLEVGAPVHLAGVKVGSVAAIQFPIAVEQVEQKDVEIVLRVGRAYQERIRKDSAAAIHTQGLLGDKFINLTAGSAAEPILQPGEHLQVREGTGLASLIDRGGKIIDNLQSVSASLKELFDEQSKDSLINALFYDPRGKQILADAAEGMRGFRRFTEGGANGANLDHIIRDLHNAAEDIREITGQIRRGEGTLGALLTDSAIYHDLRSLFGRVNRNVLLRSIVRSTVRENERKAMEP